MEKTKKFKRKLLVEKEIQIRFLIFPVFSIIVNSIFFMVMLWFVLKTPSGEPQTQNSGYYIYILIASIAVVIVNIFGTIYFGLLTSNHFIGPLYRLKKSINSLIDGSYGNKIQFREGDFKFRLAQVYNDLSAALHQRVEDDLYFIDKMKDKVRLAQSQTTGEPSLKLKEIELELDNFKKSKQQYLDNRI